MDAIEDQAADFRLRLFLLCPAVEFRHATFQFGKQAAAGILDALTLGLRQVVAL